MVVIKECFPSRSDFIADYLAKRRQQLEILQQRNFKVSFVPRTEDNIVPFETSPYHTENLNELELKTPVIIPVQDEPRYVKNFNAFIQQTQQHLNEVLANNQRIDDVHDIVSEIQKPAPVINRDQFQPGEVPEIPDYAKPGHCRVTSDLDSARSTGSELAPQLEPITPICKNKLVPKNLTKSIGQSSASRNKEGRTKIAVTGGTSIQSARKVESGLSKLGSSRRSVIASSKRTEITSYRNPGTIRNTVTASIKSHTSRTLSFSPRNVNPGFQSKRSSTIDTSRSDRTNWMNKKMSQVSVAVINLQL